MVLTQNISSTCYDMGYSHQKTWDIVAFVCEYVYKLSLSQVDRGS